MRAKVLQSDKNRPHDSLLQKSPAIDLRAFYHCAMKQLFLALLLINLSACSSMQTVSIQDLENPDIPSEIQIGERVEVSTRDNEKMQFTVTNINSDGIGGKFGFIPYENIRHVQVRRSGGNSAESLNWLWGIIGAAALIALVVSADSISACSGSACPAQ